MIAPKKLIIWTSGLAGTLAFITSIYCTYMFTTSYRFNRMSKRTASLVKMAFTHPHTHTKSLPSYPSILMLYSGLMAEYITSKDYTLRQRTFDRHTINYFSPYDLSLLVHEIFARQVYQFTSTKPNPIILDCGSNIGISILFFKTLYPQATITGFEANPATFEVLQKNITDNNLSDVTVHHKALYDSAGHIKFPRSAQAPGHPGMSMNTQNNDTVTVETVLLSDYITEEIDFVKIDIEGAEGAVIRDLSQTKRLDLIDQMIIEYHDNGNPNNDLTQILNALHENGFTYLIQSDLELPFTRSAHAGMMIYAYQSAITPQPRQSSPS